MFHFIIPLIKGRLIGLALNRILPRIFPVLASIMRNQQEKKQNPNFAEDEKITIDVEVREKKQAVNYFPGTL